MGSPAQTVSFLHELSGLNLCVLCVSVVKSFLCLMAIVASDNPLAQCRAFSRTSRRLFGNATGFCVVPPYTSPKNRALSAQTLCLHLGVLGVLAVQSVLCLCLTVSAFRWQCDRFLCRSAVHLAKKSCAFCMNFLALISVFFVSLWLNPFSVFLPNSATQHRTGVVYCWEIIWDKAANRSHLSNENQRFTR